MPHITAQWFPPDSTNSLRGQSNSSIELRGPKFSRNSQTQKLKILLTPTSIAPAIFDSPLKSSPSSSISTTNSLALVQRVDTPIAELEDTSVITTYQELEDTSNHALVSQSWTKLPAYAFKSGYPSTRSLVGAVDQQFADYEAQIRSLRNSLAEGEKSLRQARQAAYASKHALQDAQENIAHRDREIKAKNKRIAELEREVNHCQKHHPAPPTPLKLQSDAAISRFNVDARRSPKSSSPKSSSPKSSSSTNSPAAVSPTAVGRPRKNTEESPAAPPPKPEQPKYFTVSSVALSSSTESSPVLQPEIRSHTSPSAIYSPLTLENLSAAFASAAGTSKLLTEISEGHHVRKPSDELVKTSKIKSASTLPIHKYQPAGYRPLQTAASTPNLCVSKDYTPSRTPPVPPIMSGGLGSREGLNGEMSDQKLRKKRVGLGDIFRRKEPGVDSLVA